MSNSNDIAKHLGLSRGTVSRVLNNRGRVSEKTRKAVLDAAKKLEYQPNLAARALVKNRPHKVAICTFSEPAYYWKFVQEGINQSYENLKHLGFEVKIVVNDINHPEQQIEQMRELAGEGIEAIALAPNDPQIMGEVVDELMGKGIPVIIFNADVPASSRVCYVGCNYHKAGELAGHLLGNLMGGRGKVAVLTFSEPIITIQQRVMGFNEAMSDYPGIDLLPVLRLKRNAEGAYQNTLDFMRRSPDLAGIYVSFGILEEVAKAVVDSGKKGGVKIIGYDLSDGIKDFIQEGVIDCTICHEPVMQGFYVVKLLYNLTVENSRPTRRVINTKLEIVTRDNLDCYSNEVERLSIITVP